MTRFPVDGPLTAEAERELQRLWQSTWRELLELPAHSQLDLDDGGKRGTISIYRDLLPQERVRVVVQIYVSGRLGSAQVSADGFVVAMDDTRVELQDEDLYEFT
ncbi:hypothetical protein [Povalibacter sp.]|uniref:hypothetical protein n=1 Tax=Povalibacter sp. TaxID=1962978 RepID=UPI002F4069AA